MNNQIGRGIVVTLMLAGGCDNGGLGAGMTGGASGSAGGEPAAAGATGHGTTGTGSASAGGSGAGTAGASGGASGGARASGGQGGGSETGGATGVGGVAGTTWLTPPPVPPALAVPAGATPEVHVHAVGAQIYTCTAIGGANTGADAGATTYAWVLKAPDAKLYDSRGVQVGTHGAGPSWTHADGSVAHGVKVAELNSPMTDAISWLLLRVSSASGPGAFGDVTYVHRLSTIGGKAPATGCDATTVGTDTRSDYVADYYFYTGGAGAAWLTAPEVPGAIALPDGMKLREHDHGVGFQIYGCLANGGADGDAGGADADAGVTTYAWVFKAPDALLSDMNFVPVASHGAGPSWTSTDGSVVTARELARADSPLPDAIPWLLLKEYSTSGTGVFSDVAIVQRLNTVGGKAPATGCDATTANTQVRIPYAADYYFYVSVDADAGS
jgi:Protein of unknown function (DUF3455)